MQSRILIVLLVPQVSLMQTISQAMKLVKLLQIISGLVTGLLTGVVILTIKVIGVQLNGTMVIAIIL